MSLGPSETALATTSAAGKKGMPAASTWGLLVPTWTRRRAGTLVASDTATKVPPGTSSIMGA